MFKVFSKTFGCQMNFADSDEMFGHFKEKGFVRSDKEANADAILVNTCTVRQLAEHKARTYIGKLKSWKKRDPNRLIVVTGCAAEHAKKEWHHKFPHVDLIVGAKSIEQFPDELNNVLDERLSSEENLNPAALSFPNPAGVASVVQSVTIMRGCNYSCSYCIVPRVRGREKYIPVETVLNRVQACVKEGAKEIWLLGQTVNSYRPPNPPQPDYDFSDLLRDVDKISGVERLRFMSPHPFYMTPKLIHAMAECPSVCEHFHLPVQSGSNEILKRMRRNYTRESYLAALTNLRAAIPNISITTDIIVGFPGETEPDFEETLSLVKEAQFDSAYCFKYSPRPKTESAQWEDDVPYEVKQKRLDKLLALVDFMGLEKAKDLKNSTQDVLLEEEKGDNLFRGRARNGWRVRIQNPALQLGDIVPVRIVNNHSRELKATLL